MFVRMTVVLESERDRFFGAVIGYRYLSGIRPCETNAFLGELECQNADDAPMMMPLPLFLLCRARAGESDARSQKIDALFHHIRNN